MRIVLGMLLLTTAGLKLFDPSPDTISGLGLLSSPYWRMAAMEGEAILGVWLMSGALPRLLWLVTLLGFSVLASMSLYLGIMAQPSCGCFGAKLPVSPWYALALDLAALASLVLWRPAQGHLTEVSYSAILRHGFALLAGLVVILGGVCVGLTWIYGSPGEAYLYFRDESVAIEPAITNIGEIHRGETRSCTMRLINYGNTPIRIIGGTSDCSCDATNDLPTTLPPKGVCEVRIWLAFGGKPGVFQRTYVLYTNNGSQPVVVGQIVGYLTDALQP